MSRLDEATLLHADVDAFFASVEQRDRPDLRGRPVVVGTHVVMAASYEARARGVRGGMREREARSRCPEATWVLPRSDAYERASAALMVVFHETAPKVEPLSVEEAFLDVRGLPRFRGTPVEIAAALRRRVADELGLPVTVGVGRTKLVAKMASRAAKPDGLLRIDPDDERAFLDPLPVGELWGVGPGTAARLADRGVRTVADAAAQTEATLVAVLGTRVGRAVHALVRNDERQPLRTSRPRRSFGAQTALSPVARPAAELDTVVAGLAARIGRRMRAADREGRKVTVRVVLDGTGEVTQAERLAAPSASDVVLLRAARAAFGRACDRFDGRAPTLIGLVVGDLEAEGTAQLALPFPATDLPGSGLSASTAGGGPRSGPAPG